METILVVSGSSRPGNNNQKISAWFRQRAGAYGKLKFEFVDLNDLALPFFNEPNPPSLRDYQHESTKRWSAIASKADGFVFIVPEYNRGYPAITKNALDYLYTEWVNKPVAFVGYGTSSGIRAVEQLRLVAIELQMAPIREQVGIPVWEHLNGDGTFRSTEALEKKAGVMLDQLAWWTRVLKRGREQEGA